MNQEFYILIRISLNFVPEGPIDNKPALVQIMACRWISDKPLSESMPNQFIEAYMRHLGKMSKVIILYRICDSCTIFRVCFIKCTDVMMLADVQGPKWLQVISKHHDASTRLVSQTQSPVDWQSISGDLSHDGVMWAESAGHRRIPFTESVQLIFDVFYVVSLSYWTSSRVAGSLW